MRVHWRVVSLGLVFWKEGRRIDCRWARTGSRGTGQDAVASRQEMMVIWTRKKRRCGGGGRWLDSGHILKVEITGFADGLD